MKTHEKDIIRELRKNSRKSLSDISKDKNIPLTTIVNRFKKVQNEFIDKHVSLLDFSKLGFNFRTYYTIKSKDKKSLLESLINSKSVNNIQRLAHEYDFFVECIFNSIGESYDFRDKIENFCHADIIELHFVEELKKEEFIL